MGFLFADSFDLGNFALTWTTVTSPWAPNAATRFNSGQSAYINYTAGSLLSKDGLPQSSNTVFISAAVYIGTTGGATFSVRDNATNQCSIVFNPDLSISFKTGAYNGTNVQTFPSQYLAGQWLHVQIMAVIHNTAGEIHVRLNGNPADNCAATNINTRGGTANNYATGVGIVNNVAYTALNIKDFLFYDNSGAAPNAWTGDTRTYTLYPAGPGATTQFTPSSATIVQVYNNALTGNQSLAANTLLMSPAITASISAPLAAINLQFFTALSGHANVALFDAAGTTLLATATAITNPPIGWNAFAFSSPPPLAVGTAYRIAVLTDAAAALDGSGTVAWATKANSYASGFSSGSLPTTATATYNATLTFTLANYSAVSEIGSTDNDATYNYSSTVGSQDLYAFQPLPITPASIVIAQLRTTARKSDAGTRGVQTLLTSGGATVTGTQQILASSYNAYLTQYALDPATGIAWTAAGINALQAGIKVSV